MDGYVSDSREEGEREREREREREKKKRKKKEVLTRKWLAALQSVELSVEAQVCTGACVCVRVWYLICLYSFGVPL